MWIRLQHRETVQALGEFHSIGSTLREYVKDKQWVAISSSWTPLVSSPPVTFLQRDADEVEGVANATSSMEMRKMITQFLETCSLKSTLSVPRPASLSGGVVSQRLPLVEVGSLFGHLARTAELNDVVVNFALHLLASQHKDVVVIDSLTYGKFALPPQRLRSTRVVLFPIHYGSKCGGSGHWCIACVTFDWHEKTNACFLYDPLGSEVWKKRLLKSWGEWCLPLLEAWQSRDAQVGGEVVDLASETVAVEKLHVATVETIATPTQPDGTSCGLLCVAQGLNYITQDFDMQRFSQLAPSQVQTMRLRLLWLILCKSTTTTSTERVHDAVHTMRTFTQYFTSEVQVKKRARKSYSK